MERASEKGHKWPAWAGGKDDLSRVAKILEELTEGRLDEVLRKFDEETSAELDRCLSDNGRNYTRERRSRRRDEIIDSLRVKMKMKDGDDTAVGSVEEVLQELDVRTIDSVELVVNLRPAREDVVRVSFNGAKVYNSGVAVTVSSSDVGWTRQAFVQISEEIAKGVPRWSWIYRKNMGVLLYFIGYAVLGVTSLLLLLSSPLPEETKDLTAFPSFFFGAVLISPIVFKFHEIRKWAFPPLEITGGSGSGSTGSRRLSFFLAIAIPVPISVIVNLIS